MIELIFGDYLDCKEYISQFPSPNYFYAISKKRNDKDGDDLEQELGQDSADPLAWRDAIVLARSHSLFEAHSVVYFCSELPGNLDFEGICQPLIIWLDSPPAKSNKKYKEIQKLIKIKEFPLLAKFGEEKKNYIKSLNPNLSPPALDYLFQYLPGDKLSIQNAMAILPSRPGINQVRELIPFFDPEAIAKKYIKNDLAYWGELEKLIDDLGFEPALAKFYYQCKKLIKIALMRKFKLDVIKARLGNLAPRSDKQLGFILSSLAPIPEDKKLCQKLTKVYLAMAKKDIGILLLS